MDSKSSAARSQASSVVRSLTTTGLFLRKHLWAWPLAASALLLAIGWWVRGTLEREIRDDLAASLRTILNTEVAALELWFKAQEHSARVAASDARVRSLTGQLLQTDAGGDLATALIQSTAQKELRQVARPWLTGDGEDAERYAGFVILDARHRVVAADRDDLILMSHRDDLGGWHPGDDITATFERGLQGESLVSRPYPSVVTLSREAGGRGTGVPSMFAVSPVRDAEGKVVAVLGLRIRPEQDFTRVLSIGRAGESGETYAFSKDGLLLSQSRFDDQLKQIGLLVDGDDVLSILNLQLRDPQVDITEGQRPALPRSQQPLTRMVADAVAGNSGVDASGYRDYRGVPVVGAWTWLPRYQLGVGTEVDVAEAYGPLYVLRVIFWGLFGLLALAAVVIFVFTIVVSRIQVAARRAAIQAKKLGQYTLDEKIGEGGMGVVYRGHHAMLRRPTAIKMLLADKTTEGTIARFEREVQLTSQLNHPNTIVIFDYGRTDEGVFYYAMEYLEGISLEQLVRQHGPQHEGRAIHILKQICGSLAEAHGIGLVHRDIKPANILLNQRGGVDDVVKVLDFGLVKAVDSSREASLTAAGSVTGTPLYLSPEGIQSPDAVDARSDLYAVGAVGYFLLTGTPVFDGASVVEICMKHVQASPDPPSHRLGRRSSPDLEALILRCLAKQPEERPQTARDLIDELERLQASNTWSRHDALEWWQVHGASQRPPAQAAPATNWAPDPTIVLDSGTQGKE